jgi:predicted aspartyl protease
MKNKLYFVFAVVALTSSFYAQQAGAGTIEVPFEYFKNEILVQVQINGHGPLTMLLDTGTDPSAIDLETAESIGIRRSSKGQQGDGGGSDKNLAFDCKFKSLHLGGLTATNIDAAAIDLRKISERMGKHIDGVLGHSLLNKRIVQFDYLHSIVRFFEKAPTPADGATTLKFRYSDNVLIDDVLINGVKAVANLDTGSAGTFSISPRGVSHLKLEDIAAKGVAKTSVGYNGQFEHREGKLAGIKVGSVTLKDVDVVFFAPGTGHDKSPWDVNIGNRFFKDYVMTIDYQKKTVTFEKVT